MKQTLEEAAAEYGSQIPAADLLVNSMQAVENGFKAGAEWRQLQSPWISVKDKLPEELKDVLFYAGEYDTYFSFPFAAHIEKNKDGLWICNIVDGEEVLLDDYWYWMSIPELPKGGEECTHTLAKPAACIGSRRIDNSI